MDQSPYEFPEVKAHNDAMAYLQENLPRVHEVRYQALHTTRDSNQATKDRIDIIRILTLHNILDNFREDPSHYLEPPLRQSNAILIPEIAGTLQELITLSHRIFSNILPFQIVETWIQAALRFPGNQTVTLQQTQADWAFIDVELRATSERFTSLGEYQRLTPRYDMPPRTTVPHNGKQLAGWTDCSYDPQRGKAAVLRSLELHHAGRQILTSGQYLPPQ